jgi:hypothetical protein
MPLYSAPGKNVKSGLLHYNAGMIPEVRWQHSVAYASTDQRSAVYWLFSLTRFSNGPIRVMPLSRLS